MKFFRPRPCTCHRSKKLLIVFVLMKICTNAHHCIILFGKIVVGNLLFIKTLTSVRVSGLVCVDVKTCLAEAWLRISATTQSAFNIPVNLIDFRFYIRRTTWCTIYRALPPDGDRYISILNSFSIVVVVVVVGFNWKKF